MKFAVTLIRETARSVFVFQKIRAFFRIVSLYKIGVNPRFSLADMTAAAQKPVNLVTRDKTAPDRFKTVNRVKFRDRFIQIVNPFIQSGEISVKAQAEQIMIFPIRVGERPNIRRDPRSCFRIFQQFPDLKRSLRESRRGIRLLNR